MFIVDETNIKWISKDETIAGCDYDFVLRDNVTSLELKHRVENLTKRNAKKTEIIDIEKKKAEKERVEEIRNLEKKYADLGQKYEHVCPYQS